MESASSNTAAERFISELGVFGALSLGNPMKYTFTNIFSNLRYESNLLQTSVDLQVLAHHTQMEVLSLSYTQAVSSDPLCTWETSEPLCLACARPFTLTYRELTLFYCGHLYHNGCLSSKNLYRGVLQCPHCIMGLK
jgi:hypothetical protein